MVGAPDDPAIRIAENESAFRRANETLRSLFESNPEADSYPFLCECGDSDCTVVVRASLEQYEAVREDAARFLIAPGHRQLDTERIVDETDEFLVIETTGPAGELARARWLTEAR
jgi:hypothetical protein